MAEKKEPASARIYFSDDNNISFLQKKMHSKQRTDEVIKQTGKG